MILSNYLQIGLNMEEGLQLMYMSKYINANCNLPVWA